MKILAIDTSSATCSVAITEDTKKIIELHSDDEKTHSVKLMPMIDKVFQETKLNLDDISLLSCSIGPGSFTGVRIGIATIKAFADVKNIPVVGISSLEGLAYNLVEDISKDDLNDTLICSIIDAKNHNAYCGWFEFKNDKLNQISELISEDIEFLIEKTNQIIQNQYSRIIFVGDASSIYKELLEDKIVCLKIEFADISKNISNSTSIAILGLSHYQDGNYGDSNSLHPLYLRKSQAERALEEKK